MNSEISEIIKDLSEAALAITSAVCLAITTMRATKSKKSKKRKKK